MANGEWRVGELAVPDRNPSADPAGSSFPARHPLFPIRHSPFAIRRSLMPVRPLVFLPDPQLRRISEPVTAITDDIRALAGDMLDTMYDAPGVGLAAIQIGIAQRVVTIDVSKGEGERRPLALVNPEITWASDETRVYEEGCLSIPEVYHEVERPERVRFRALNLDGETVEGEADGLLATCLQHEIDHLDGVLFIDHLSKLKRDRVLKKFQKAAKREAAE